jgi:hypothetical protein
MKKKQSRLVKVCFCDNNDDDDCTRYLARNSVDIDGYDYDGYSGSTYKSDDHTRSQRMME